MAELPATGPSSVVCVQGCDISLNKTTWATANDWLYHRTHARFAFTRNTFSQVPSLRPTSVVQQAIVVW